MCTHRPINPKNTPLSLSETMSPKSISATPTMAPPPVPWIVRPAMSIALFCAAPHNALPIPKSRTDTSMTGFRPNTSERPPIIGRNAVEDSTYDAAIQTKSVASRSSTIRGSAVDTEVSSNAKRVSDEHMATNDIQKRASFGVLGGSFAFPASAVADSG